MSPSEVINTSIGTSDKGEISKDDMIQFMNEDEKEEVIKLDDSKEKDKTEPKEKDDDKKTGEERTGVDEKEEEDELKELEEELKEPDEEKLELVTPIPRREILAKYPSLFKDFPYLEKAYYREQQFTELLPTIEDAKIAVEKSSILDKFESDVMNGSVETILATVKQTDPRAFHKIVDNYITTLGKVDEQAYYHVLSNISKHTIMAMVREGQRSNNETLKQAAQVLNQFIFGSSDFQPPSVLSTQERPEDNTREEQIKRREREFTERQFESTRGELNTRVNNVLRSTIDANIDPKQSMTDYVRRNASRDAMDSLESLISQDTRFRTLVDKLWEKAFEDGFKHQSVDRIRSAYISKAKTLLPSVIKKARIEALRGMGRKSDDDSNSEENNKSPIPVGRPRPTTSGKIKDAKEIPKGMRTLDFLMQD